MNKIKTKTTSPTSFKGLYKPRSRKEIMKDREEIGNFQKVSDSECMLTNAKNYRYQKSGQGFGYVAKSWGGYE